MKTATNVLIVLAMGVMMVTASALFTAGYPLTYAKKSSDSGSGSSGSGSGGSANDGSGNGKSDPEPSPPKDDQNGKTTIDNPPVTTEPVTPSTPTNTGGDAGACVVGVGSPCNGQPAGHPNKPNLPHPDKDCAFDPDVLAKCKPGNNGQCPPGFSHNAHDNCFPNGKCPPGLRQDEDESGKCFPDKHGPPNQIIVIHKTIHSSSSSSSSSGSYSLSKGCFDAIKIAWLGKVHRGENHEVDQFIDKCLGVH